MKKPNKVLEFFIGAYCMAMLFPTLGLLQATSIYTAETPSGISYNYRTFYFPFTIIPIFIVSFLKAKSFLPKFKYIIGAIALKDVIYLASGRLPSNIPYDLSLFLVLISGYAICVTIFSLGKNPLKSASKFLDIYMLITIFTQYVRIVLGYSTDGRYGAIGQTVGAFGFLTSLYILYSLCVKRKITVLMLMSLLSLIMTGQRTHLFLCIMFCFLFVIYGKLYKKKDKYVTMKIRFMSAAFLFMSVFLCIFMLMIAINVDFSNFAFLDRTIDSLNAYFNDVSSKDDSVEGRFLSNAAGLEVLYENPYGISNVFYDLQYRISQVGYPTFPHNFILANSLLWSPVILFYCVFWMFRLVKGLHKKKDMMVLIPLYLLVSAIIWGSPIMDYTFLFIILFFSFYSKIYYDSLNANDNVGISIKK